jgi:hypothetical protein
MHACMEINACTETNKIPDLYFMNRNTLSLITVNARRKLTNHTIKPPKGKPTNLRFLLSWPIEKKSEIYYSN